MTDEFIILADQLHWLQNVALILVFFLLAWIVQRLSRRTARRFVRLGRFSPRGRQLRRERQATLESLLASTISTAAFLTAVLASVGLFVEATTLIWMIGLFSAAFGFGARPVISDFLSGVSLIFEDSLAVGEKVEILGAVSGVEGVVEAVYLRTTLIRAATGELLVVPNGEVRMVRNFSRGRFSTANITLKIAAADLNHALPLLKELGVEAVEVLPNLLEAWQVISETGVAGQITELTLLARARFGKAAEMRPRLLALVQERLAAHGIELVD